MIGLWLSSLACHTPNPVPDDILVVSQEQQVSWQRIFNPLLINGSTRWPTNAGIYEPMLIYNPMQGEYVPWLATEYRFNSDATELSLTMRDGVKWSDGTDFDADDVKFTFELMRDTPGLDGRGLWRDLEEIVVVGDTVRFRFKESCFSGLERIAHQSIVPEHIWKDIENPGTFPNPEPVGTGPFTEVTHFSSQSWRLERNPHYWQELGIQGMEFPALPSNEQATLALLQGEVDWAGNFLPAIDRIFVERDPEHHNYWFPTMGASVLLYPNHMRAPFDDVNVRKAISLSINRDLLVKVALHNYVPPADESGLSSAYKKWRMDDWDSRDRWAAYDPQRAGELLDQAGWTLVDGRRQKDGQVLELKVSVVSGWSDWVRAAQVVSRSLQEVGIEASVLNQDFGSWFQRLQQGDFDLSLGWSEEGPHPIGFYESMLSARAVKPIGENASINWHRYAYPEADALVDAFEQTADPQRQVEIGQALQTAYVENVPTIPLFLNPSWGEFNSDRITGFPSEDNPYARLSPNHVPETLLVMTQLKVAP
jgi:peptide/nickel transport system substrate-binding protein